MFSRTAAAKQSVSRRSRDKLGPRFAGADDFRRNLDCRPRVDPTELFISANASVTNLSLSNLVARVLHRAPDLLTNLAATLVSSSLNLPISGRRFLLNQSSRKKTAAALAVGLTRGLDFACECRWCCHRDQRSSPFGILAWRVARFEI